MATWLDPVRRALDEIAAPVAFFFRDDDAGWADDRLWPLLDVFQQHHAPVDVAVIPQALSPAAARALAARAGERQRDVRMHMHGFAHENHEPTGKKCEFGPARDEATQRRDLEAGQRRLREFLGEDIDPVFTPPWNRCTPTTARLLVELGFRGLSRDVGETRFAIPGLSEIPIRVDWQRRGDDGIASVGTRLAAAIPGGPVGLMLHHALLDWEERRLLGELLALLRGHANARCRTMAELLAAGEELNVETTSLPDLASVRAFLRSAGASAAVDQLEESYVHAAPDGSVAVLYEGPGEVGDVLRLAARCMPLEAGQALAEELNGGRTDIARAPFLQGAFYAPTLQLLFQVFPVDTELPGLPAAADAGTIAPALDAVLSRGVASARMADVAVEVVRYKPGRRCLFRYTIGWVGTDGGRRAEVVYGKVLRQKDLERARDVLPRLLASGELGFRLPAPRGTIPALGLEILSPLAGIPLSDCTTTEGFGPLCRRVGEALHALHGLSVVLDHTEPAFEAGRVGAAAQAFAWLAPSEARRIHDLARELDARLGVLPPRAVRPVHGDFHGDNVLVDGTQLALIDFEDAGMGEPASDVGSMWAQLTWLAIKAGARESRALAGRDAFLDAYLTRADGATADRVPLQAALHAFLFAGQCLRHLRRRARQEHARALLAVCADVLEGGL